MDCRGKDRRKQIVDKYNVVPTAHIKLLAGQEKNSDAGGKIEREYYIFKATSRDSGNQEIILCGMGAARDFLKLLNHSGLPVFNPLHEEGGYGDGNPVEGDGGNGGGNHEWNPIARQLYHACMWVIIIIDANGGTPIFEIQERVYNFKNREPYAGQVKGVNTIIMKSLQGRTLTEAIDTLRADNRIRDELCQFDMLIDIINNARDNAGNAIRSYF